MNLSTFLKRKLWSITNLVLYKPHCYPTLSQHMKTRQHPLRIDCNNQHLQRTIPLCCVATEHKRTITANSIEVVGKHALSCTGPKAACASNKSTQRRHNFTLVAPNSNSAHVLNMRCGVRLLAAAVFMSLHVFIHGHSMYSSMITGGCKRVIVSSIAELMMYNKDPKLKPMLNLVLQTDLHSHTNSLSRLGDQE